MTWGISVKFSGKMWPLITLKATKNQSFTLSLESRFSGKPQGGAKLTPSSGFRAKESTSLFSTKLCHYHWSKVIKTLCVHYQKLSQQYTEEENTFLSCQNLRGPWDFKINSFLGYILSDYEIYLVYFTMSN